MAYSFDDAGAAERHTTQYFEMFVQPRHLPPGLDRGDPPQHPVGHGPDMPGLRRRRLGAVRARRLDAGARHLAAEQPEQLARPPAAVPDRGRQVQRAAARRPAGRALQRRPGRPAAADPGQPPDPVRGHGPAVRELGRGHEEQVVSPSRRRSSCPRAAPAARSSPRAARSGAGACTANDGTPGVLLQPVRAQAVQGLRRRRRSLPASTRSASSSPTTAADSARAATSPSTSTARRSARAGSTRPCRWCSPADETTDVGSDTGTPVTDDLTEGAARVHGPRQVGPDRPRRRRRGRRTT